MKKPKHSFRLRRIKNQTYVQRYFTHFSCVFILSAPLLISAISGQAAGLINSILTGHYSPIDLAAVSYGFIMTMTIGSIARGALGSLLPVLQNANKTNDSNTRMACFYTLIVYLVFSVLLFGLFFIGSYFLTVSGDYQETIRSYLMPMLIFLLALQLLAYLVNSLIIHEKIKRMALFGLCATIIDVAISSLLVHGVGWLPSLGAQGAALGSMAGSITVTSLAFWYLKRSELINTRLTAPNAPMIKQVMSLIKMSIPAGFTALLTWLVMFGVAMLLTFMEQAETNTAANQVLLVLSTLLLVFSKVSAGIMVKRFNDVDNKMQFLLANVVGYQIFYVCLCFIISAHFEAIVRIFGINEVIVEQLNLLKGPWLFYLLFSCVDTILTSFFVSQQKNATNLKIQGYTLLFVSILAMTLFVFEHLTLNTLWQILVLEKCLMVAFKVSKINGLRPRWHLTNAGDLNKVN